MKLSYLAFVVPVCLLAPLPSVARAGSEEKQNKEDNIGITASFAVGPTLFLKSKSNALGHLLSPVASLSVSVPWRGRFLFGGQVLAALENNEHYQVLGLLASGSYAFWQRAGFDMGLQLGVGVGKDADILNSDHRGGGVGAYATAGIDARWSVGKSWIVGAQLDTLNLAFVRVAPVLAYRF